MPFPSTHTLCHNLVDTRSPSFPLTLSLFSLSLLLARWLAQAHVHTTQHARAPPPSDVPPTFPLILFFHLFQELPESTLRVVRKPVNHFHPLFCTHEVRHIHLEEGRIPQHDAPHIAIHALTTQVFFQGLTQLEQTGNISKYSRNLCQGQCRVLVQRIRRRGLAQHLFFKNRPNSRAHLSCRCAQITRTWS